MKTANELILNSARKGKCRAGQTSLIKHLTGHRLTQRQAIAAKCYDCNGMGEQDECEMEHCSLLPYSPYRKNARKSSRKASSNGPGGQ